jgi:hypothetical protein
MKWFTVEIEPGVWLADWKGDPGRTLNIAAAEQFKSMESAIQAVKRARKYRPFPDARIMEW